MLIMRDVFPEQEDEEEENNKMYEQGVASLEISLNTHIYQTQFLHNGNIHYGIYFGWKFMVFV